MALPLRSKNPPESFPFATIFLIVANVFVYIVTTENGLTIRESVVQNWAIKSSDFSLLKMFTGRTKPASMRSSRIFRRCGEKWILDP